MTANPLFLAKWNVHVFGARYNPDDSSHEMQSWKKLQPSDQMHIFACRKLTELLSILLECKRILEDE